MRGGRRRAAIGAGLTARMRRPRAPVLPAHVPLDPSRTFFLVGRGKSGTSWLMRTLDEHPEILCRGEGRFFGDSQPDALEGPTLYHAMLESEDLRAWAKRSVWTRGDDPDRRLADLAGVVATSLMWSALQRSGKRIVGDKTPSYGASAVREVAASCPGARVIHIIRDGRDVAVSAAHHIWNHLGEEPGEDGRGAQLIAARDAYRKDPVSYLASGKSIFVMGQLHGMALRWVEMTSAARRDGRELLGDRYAEVRYEDLLASGPRELSRLLSFLGVAADPETAAGCLERTRFARLSKGREPGAEDSRSFYRKGIAGDWRNVFTEDNRRVFKEVAGDLLSELGYERDDRP